MCFWWKILHLGALIIQSLGTLAGPRVEREFSYDTDSIVHHAASNIMVKCAFRGVHRGSSKSDFASTHKSGRTIFISGLVADFYDY